MANEENVARLLRSVKDWNTWRAKSPESTPALGTTKLIGANLGGGVWLTGANLRKANLESAYLEDTRLGRADLHGANFTQAFLSGAIFADVNLTQTIGLASCSHCGPSLLDSRTLQYGPLPVAFLRGCGLPDSLIDSLPVLLKEPQALDKLLRACQAEAALGEMPTPPGQVA
jgi:hypothetical protein